MIHLYSTKMSRVAESTSKIANHSIKWNIKCLKAANAITNNNVDNHAR